MNARHLRLPELSLRFLPGLAAQPAGLEEARDRQRARQHRRPAAVHGGAGLRHRRASSARSAACSTSPSSAPAWSARARCSRRASRRCTRRSRGCTCSGPGRRSSTRRSSLDDVVVAEWVWAASKAVISTAAILLVLMALGYGRTPLALWVLPLGFLVGLTFGAFGLVMNALAPGYDFFTYFFTLVLTPMLLLSGVFFPVDADARGAAGRRRCAAAEARHRPRAAADDGAASRRASRCTSPCCWRTRASPSRSRWCSRAGGSPDDPRRACRRPAGPATSRRRSRSSRRARAGSRRRWPPS